MSAVNDMLTNYQHIIESLTITPGSKGVYDVTVDGELLFSKHGVGRHADAGEILELFTERFGQGVERYGTTA